MRQLASKLAAALAVVAAVTAAATVPAAADPAVTPAAQDIVGAGSKTLVPLWNRLANDYNAGVPAGAPHIYIWDTTGYSPITPKTGGATIPRPTGCGAGLSTLNNYTSSTLDFVFCTRGPVATDLANDWFIAFGKDGITWSSTSTSNSPANLTFNDLVGIYTCTITNWSQIVDIAGYVGPNVPIKPFLPQYGSGTRDTWLKILGGGVTPITPGACVTSGPEEDQGTDPILNDPDVVFPYSAGRYAGQLNGINTPVDNVGVLVLRQVDGIDPLTPPPPPFTVSPALASSRYGRVLYDVVRGTDWNASDQHAFTLQGIFASTGWLCANVTASSDIALNGYLGLPAGQCGTISHT